MLETFLCDKYSIIKKRTIREHVKNSTSLTMIIYSKSKREIRSLHIVSFDEMEEGVKELFHKISISNGIIRYNICGFRRNK